MAEAVATSPAYAYLQQQNIEQIDRLFSELGVLVTSDKKEAAEFVGLPTIKGEWDEYILLPTINPDGSVDPNNAQVIPLAVDAFTGAIKRSRLCTPGANRASFFGSDSFYGQTLELTVHESWLKAANHYLRTSDYCIGLNGQEGITEGDHFVQYIGPQEAPWTKASAATLVFDHPNILKQESQEASRRAKDRAAKLFGMSCSQVYDAPIPLLPGRATSDFNDCMASISPSQILERRTPLNNSTSEVTVSKACDIVNRQENVWLINNWLLHNEHTAIFGDPGCGKSFYILDMLMALAQPEVTQWRGNEITQHGAVLHITLEGKGLPNRLRAYMAHNQLSSPPANYYAIEHSINMRDHSDIDKLIQACHDVLADSNTPLVAVVVDTFNRAFAGGDENGPKDVGMYLASVNKIMDAFRGVTFVSIHHSGKDKSKGLRGHSSFEGAVGGIVEIRSNSEGIRTSRTVKMRDGQTGTQDHWKLLVVELPNNQTSCVVVDSEAPAHIDKPALQNFIYAWWKHGPYKGERHLTEYNMGRDQAEGLRQWMQQEGVSPTMLPTKAQIKEAFIAMDKTQAPNGARNGKAWHPNKPQSYVEPTSRPLKYTKPQNHHT